MNVHVVILTLLMLISSAAAFDFEPVDRPTFALTCEDEENLTSPLMAAMEDFDAAVEMIDASKCAVIDLAVEFDVDVEVREDVGIATANVLVLYTEANSFLAPTIWRVDLPCGADFYMAIEFPVAVEELRRDLEIRDFSTHSVLEFCATQPAPGIHIAGFGDE